LTRSLSLPVSISRSQVHLTSAAVNGLPSCHLIERKLAEEQARPIIFYPRGGTCTQPYVKGLVTMVNSIYNGYRMEDVWLDK
jgi:hypothetical protein